MNKTLYQLTKEDWNSLFPVELVDHNANWKNIFEVERAQIAKVLSEYIALRIEHFGSTAIPNIKAKPYIDIIIDIPQDLLFDEDIIAKLATIGYVYFKVPEREGIDAYMSFGKGYDLEGKKEQIFHIHMCPAENIMWRQLAFRDYLISHVAKAQEYENLKLDLALKFKHDRGGYVLGKTDFINETLKLIKKESASKIIPEP